MKFGFDIHGVLDTHSAVYAAITQALLAAEHEIHIITGSIKSQEEVDRLAANGVVYTHWFSVAQYHIDKGDADVWFVEGKPWMDQEVWDRTKADYCHEEGIAWHIDDSPVYGQFFNKDTVYSLQRDPTQSHAWEGMER